MRRRAKAMAGLPAIVIFTFCALHSLGAGEHCDTRPQWHLDRLDQESGLDSCYTPNIVPRAKPVLYVIDSGVYAEHEEFTSGNRVIKGYNFQESSWDSGDCSGHGTHVAALAAGKTFGVAGSIPVDIVSVRVLNCEGRGSCSGMIRAMDWVLQNHTIDRPTQSGVIVMSVGSQRDECKAADVAAEALMSANILVVAAAGNSAIDACTVHPASAKNTVAVGAVGIDDVTGTDTVWSRSNYGPCVDIHAPGDKIVSAGIESPSAAVTRTGTSMAAPMIAGQGLLIMAAAPELPISVVRDIIIASGSRGTLDRNVRSIASSVHIAWVPWRKLDFRRSESLFQESAEAESRPIDTHFTGDIVEIDLETTSVTKPPMHFIGQGVAKNITHKIQFALADSEIDTDAISTECYLSPADAPSAAFDEKAVIPLKMRCFVWSESGSAKTVAVQLALLAADEKSPMRTAADGLISFSPKARIAQSSVKSGDSSDRGIVTESHGEEGVKWLIASGVVAGVALVVGISVMIIRHHR